MGPTASGIALALIAVVVGAELVWDLAHGSAGTHWVLKIVVVVGAAVGIALLRLRRGSPRDGRGAASSPRPGPEDADPD
jgi:hypothetical protein